MERRQDDEIGAAQSEPSTDAPVVAAHAAAPSPGAADLTLGLFVAPPPPAEQPGTLIGRYKLLQLIGEGGFGTVYMAEQQGPLVRRVALKIIKWGMDTRQVVARFEAERQALAVMDHPNIAKVFDAGATDAGRPYFVMELVRGVPITDYCDRNQLTTAERLGLFIDVCNAVQHAHQKGIIHRDLKPTNVLVTLHDGRPVPKVIDFGIAKATSHRLTEKTLFTEFNQFVGTPAYMSPEQAEMSGLDVDTRSDVYSLGVLLYELLTGATPFDSARLRAAGYGEIQRIIREVEPARPSARLSTMGAALAEVARHRKADPAALGRQVRGDLDWIVMRCLEKDRTRRYETASSLAADVRRHLSEEPVEAGPPSGAYRIGKLVRRNKGPFAAAGAVVLAVVAGLVASTVLYVRADAARGRAEAAELAERRQALDADAARRQALTQKALADASAAQARREAGNADAVSRFLEQMFRSLDPNRPTRAEVPLLDVLSEAGRKLDGGALKDQPEHEASVRMVLANLCSVMALRDQGERHARRAYELRKATLGDHVQTLQSLRKAILYMKARPENAAAVELLERERLEMSRRVRGPEHADVAEAMMELAHRELNKGDPAAAESLASQALEMSRRVSGEESVEVLRALGLMSAVMQFSNRPEEAKQFKAREQALMTTLSRRNVIRAGSGRPPSSQPIESITGPTEAATAAARQGDPRRTVEQMRRTLGPAHPATAASMQLAATYLAGRGEDLELAEQWAREALEIERRAFGASHVNSGQAVGTLARVLEARGKDADAETTYRDAIEVLQKALGDRYAFTIEYKRRLAALLQKRGDEAGAAELLRTIGTPVTRPARTAATAGPATRPVTPAAPVTAPVTAPSAAP